MILDFKGKNQEKQGLTNKNLENTIKNLSVIPAPIITRGRFEAISA
jgi:hypothetical protein